MSARLAADRSAIGQPRTESPVGPSSAAAVGAPATAGDTPASSVADPAGDAPPAPLFASDGDGGLTAQRDAPVGGQAVLEGVMMRGVSNWSVAVRKPTAEQLAEHERPPTEA